MLSTVTTTFLDAWSAWAISAESLSSRLSGKWTAGCRRCGRYGGAAIFFPMDDITGFLYLIGSVFAPMIAIQIANHFLLKRNCDGKDYDARNLIIWVIGFVLYRLLMNVDIIVGNTLPDMLITMLLCIVTELVIRSRARKK